MRHPYLALAPDISQASVGGVPVARVKIVGEVKSAVVHWAMLAGQHVTGEFLPLDALDHIASHSNSAGPGVPAVAEEIAALRYSLSLYPCEYVSNLVYQ